MDYSDIRWVFVHSIERTDELEIQVSRDRHTTIYTYDSPEQCLENLMILKKKWREASGKKWEYQQKGRTRLSYIR